MSKFYRTDDDMKFDGKIGRQIMTVAAWTATRILT